jgi:DNA-binding NtrC family response regulator
MSPKKKSPGLPRQKLKPLIYLVDDEPVLLDLAQMALDGAGYQLRTFNDPEEALKEFSRARVKPDVLITDYAMGKINGLELIQRCLRFHPTLKSIIISGTAGAEVLMHADIRVDRYLSKPYPQDQLANLVKELLPV